MILLDALEISIYHVGHGDEVAIQKGHTIVIILDVQAFPHIRSHLVHKTEKAVVGTMPDAVKHGRLKLNPQLLVIVLVKLIDLLLTVLMLHQHLNFLVSKGKAHVNNIPEPCAVDFQKLVTGNQLQLLCQAAGINLQYSAVHLPPPL